jgi:hypothetical protein
LVFAAGFVPFLANGHAGIVKNVLQYHSFNNAPFWHVFLPIMCIHV